MPIGHDEWKRGRTSAASEADSSVKERLLEFLELNPGRAYTTGELAKAYAREVAGETIAGESPGESHLAAPDPSMLARVFGRLGETVYRRSGRINAALDELVEEGKVECKTIETVDGEQTYYRIAAEEEWTPGEDAEGN